MSIIAPDCFGFCSSDKGCNGTSKATGVEPTNCVGVGPVIGIAPFPKRNCMLAGIPNGITPGVIVILDVGTVGGGAGVGGYSTGGIGGGGGVGNFGTVGSNDMIILS